MAVDTGYIANNASQIRFNLPTTASVGKVVAVAGVGAGGWMIGHTANQVIHFGFVSSMTGPTGNIFSSHRYDAVEMVCAVADNEWVVRSSVGNINVTIS
jgi:hypothetical protein